MEQLNRFHTDLQEIFGMLKYRGSKEELISYIRANEQYFRNVDEDTYHAIREFLHSEKVLKEEVSKRSGEEKIDMCKALEDLYNDGVEQGEQNILLRKIRVKLDKGKSVEEIADALEESVETIEQLVNKFLANYN